MTGICLLPSLNRIDQLKEFFKAYTQAEWEIPGWILVDSGDYISKQPEYLALELPVNWKIIETKEITMGGKCRELWNEYKDLDWVMLLNDDHRPRTNQGDKKILSQLTGLNLLGTNDGPTPDKPWNAPKRICGATTWSGQLLRSVGYMFPENLDHLFIDDLWGQLCGRAGCGQVVMDVCVEHDHAYIHKREDATHRKVNSQESWNHDQKAFQEWMQKDFQEAVKRVTAIQPKVGVMVCTPCHDGNASLDFGVGLMDTSLGLAGQNIYMEFARVDGSSLIPHARNSLVHMFLNSRCQKLLFVDSDQSYNRNHVFWLLGSDKPIIAGVTPHKRFPININFEPLKEDEKYFKELANKGPEEFFQFAKARGDGKGEIEVNRAGTGFIMIDRSVFERMKEMSEIDQYKAFDDREDVIHTEYFKMGAEERGGRYHGEDWYFCKLAKKLGIPIHIQSNVCVGHKGSYSWTIDESKRLI